MTAYVIQRLPGKRYARQYLRGLGGTRPKWTPDPSLARHFHSAESAERLTNPAMEIVVPVESEVQP